MSETKLFFISLFILFSCQLREPLVDQDRYLDFSLEQVTKTIHSQSDFQRFPRNIRAGESEWSTTGITGWTSGFWPGILWYMYEFSANQDIKQFAQQWTESLKGLKNWTPKDHDLGFMVYCSFANGYRLTGNSEYKKFILEMADSLSTLFNPNVGTILSWPGRKNIGNIEISGTMKHNTIIDNMMNLELLFWSFRNGGNPHLYDIAVQHALTTMKNHIRPDFSSYHVVLYDSLSGDVGHRITHQGYSDESMWARGQAWGIYGFTVAYRETGMPEFLETAKKMAQVYLDRLPSDYVPFWDFDAPNIPFEEKDASAAAIAASAILELSGLIKEDKEKLWYREEASKILRSLGENYISNGTDHAILWHSVGNRNRNSEVDVPIIYADYYFIEGLTREKRLKGH
jgi:unsaturated chondroitin disaccharide hydrolase